MLSFQWFESWQSSFRSLSFPTGSAHARFLKILFLLFFPGASPLYLTYFRVVETYQRKVPSVTRAPPFGLLWYFAVFSVASCYCVNKFIFISSKSRQALVFSASLHTDVPRTWLHLNSQEVCLLRCSSLLTWTCFQFIPSLN